MVSSQTPRGRAILSGSTPSWVLSKYAAFGPIPTLAADFSNNLFWEAGLGKMSADAALSITRASTEYAVDTSGNWTSFGNGVIARTNAGLNAWEARTNLFLNSQTPVTQTITAVSSSVYTVSVYGNATVTLSGGGSGTASAGSPRTFTASTTSVVCTVTGAGGTFQNVNFELGSFATPPIVTAGSTLARAADVVTLNTNLIPAFGSGITIFAAGVPNVSAVGNTNTMLNPSDGSTANSINLTHQGNASAAANKNVASGGNSNIGTGIGTWAVNVPGKNAAATDAASFNGYFNGSAYASGGTAAVPTGLNKINIGVNVSSANYWNGQITDFAVWATQRVPNANLQALTGATW